MRPWRALGRLLHAHRPASPAWGSRELHAGQLVYSEEVRRALQHGEPVVALESTIITHGMPAPTNLQMAEEVEGIIRSHGATPATVAVLAGRVHVGLDRGQLEELAAAPSPVKTSRRDFPWVLANRLDGGTTVSGTMLVAHKAGIEIFVTGGVGGVHRGGQDSMDVSADLTELGRTPVTVVSAGVKSILDIGRTLEYLETQGVCVATLGPTHAFPAFYTGDSGHRAPYRVGSPLEAARLVQAGSLLGLRSGILLAVPVPPSEAGPGERIEAAVQTALEEAERGGVRGREVTPFVLARLNELTEGESLRANLALVRNNARAGAEVAVELARLRAGGLAGPSTSSSSSSSTSTSTSSTSSSFSTQQPLVVGGSNLDFVVRMEEGEVSLNGGTHRGSLASGPGGVGRNVASALARLGTSPKLASAVGEDPAGRQLLDSTDGLDTSLVLVVPGARTAAYTAVLDARGDCRFGVGDMDIHACISPDYLLGLEEEVARAPLVVVDGNLPQESVLALMDLCWRHKVPLFYEPTDLGKACLPLASPHLGALTYCSPNLAELAAQLATVPGETELPAVSTATADRVLPEVAAAAGRLVRHHGLSVLLVTMSECGVLLVRRGRPEEPLPLRGAPLAPLEDCVSAVWYRGTPCPAASLVSVSGAGDCLAAGFIAGVVRGLCQAGAVAAGLQAARQSCAVAAAVPGVLHVDWQEVAQGIRLL